MRGRGVLAGVIVVAGFAACAPAAPAAVLDGANNYGLIYTADSGETNRLTVIHDPRTDELVFRDPGATIRFAPNTDCVPDPLGARCSAPSPAEEKGTHLELGDLDDTVETRIPYGVRINGGYGNDRLAGSPAQHDSIDGYSGDDVIITADGASDSVTCGIGLDMAVVDPFDFVNSWAPQACERLVGTSPIRL